jgi:sterol carrier protein 2
MVHTKAHLKALFHFQLITYPALGLCPPGDAHKLVERGDNTVRMCHLLYSEIYACFAAEQYGGKYVINPSGGLEAKGHPLGATGLGMHFYIMSKVLPSNVYAI